MSAAIDVQDVTGDRGGVGQVHDRIRDVPDRGRPTQRRQAFHDILRSVSVKRRVDGAGRHGVHADAVFGVLHRQVLGDRLKTAFGDHRHCRRDAPGSGCEPGLP